MTTVLYHGEPNGPSLSVLAAIFECGVDVEFKHIDLPKLERHNLKEARETEVSLSVEGEGPVLVVDGEALCDSVFIGCYLDEVAGGGKIRPGDPYKRWDMMMWCRQVIERLAPAASYLGIREFTVNKLAEMDNATLTSTLDKVESKDLRDRWASVAKGEFDDAKVDDSVQKVKDWTQRIEARLSQQDWIQDEFSLADIETYAWLVGMQDIVPEAFNNVPRTLDWMSRMQARKSVSKAMSHAKTDTPQKSWAPGPEINRWG